MRASCSRACSAGGPTVAQMMAPYADEIATHEFEKLEPIGRVTLRPRKVNWKNVGDNYSDGLHIPVAHPGLTRLFGATYRVESREWIDRMSGELSDKPSRNWAERVYQKHLPVAEHLPPERAPLLGVLQAVAQLRVRRLPGPGGHHAVAARSRPPRRLIREIGYARPDDRREMRVARYCNWRINRQVNEEDRVLIERVQNGMASGSYRVGPLAAGEVALRSFGKRMRDADPRMQRAGAAGGRLVAPARRGVDVASDRSSQAGAGTRDDRRRRQHDRLGHLPAAGHARHGRQRHHHRLGIGDRRRDRAGAALRQARATQPMAGGPASYVFDAFGPFAGMQASLWYWTSCLIGNVAIAAAAAGYLAAFFGITAGPALMRIHHHRADVAGHGRQHGEPAVCGPVQWTAADRRPRAAAADRHDRLVHVRPRAVPRQLERERRSRISRR